MGPENPNQWKYLTCVPAMITLQPYRFLNLLTVREKGSDHATRRLHPARIGSVIQVMLGPPTPWYRWFEIRSRNRYQGGQSTAMVIREVCPACASHQFKKNGHMHNDKQNQRGKACGRPFVLQSS